MDAIQLFLLCARRSELLNDLRLLQIRTDGPLTNEHSLTNVIFHFHQDTQLVSFNSFVTLISFFLIFMYSHKEDDLYYSKVKRRKKIDITNWHCVKRNVVLLTVSVLTREVSPLVCDLNLFIILTAYGLFKRLKW